jgi:hypothetical protein
MGSTIGSQDWDGRVKTKQRRTRWMEAFWWKFFGLSFSIFLGNFFGGE